MYINHFLRALLEISKGIAGVCVTSRFKYGTRNSYHVCSITLLSSYGWQMAFIRVLGITGAGKSTVSILVIYHDLIFIYYFPK